MARRRSQRPPDEPDLDEVTDVPTDSDEADAPREPLMSAVTFIESTGLKGVQRDLVLTLARLEKHTLTEWRQRLTGILEHPTGGNA